MTLNWDTFAGGLAAIEAELRAGAPDATAADEAGPYITRLLISALHDGFLPYEDMATGLKRAWPRLGGPFLDYRMWQAPLDPARTYRLTGSLNDVERLGVGTYAVTPEGVLLLEDYVVFRSGDFTLDIGAQGQLKTTGNTRLLMLREFLRPPGRRAADLQLTFGETTAAWKGAQLECHVSQSVRNQRTRHMTFADRILRVNAAVPGLPPGTYAERFQAEFFGYPA